MWYVEYLLLNRETIKERCELDSPEYDDLISVDTTLSKLIKSGIVSGEELSVLDRIINMEDFGFTDLPKIEKHPETITKLFVGVCAKISAVLGGMFTNAGYVHYIQAKYNLDDDQAKIIESYMLSKFRHKILTKPYTEKGI